MIKILNQKKMYDSEVFLCYFFLFSIMVSVNDVIELARKNGFEFVIIFYDKNDQIKMAMGLNGLTKTINDVILSYLNLINVFGVKHRVEFYNVNTKQQIDFMDIPMFFAIEDNVGTTIRQGGYM